MTIFTRILLLLVSTCFSFTASSQCAMCKAVVETADQNSGSTSLGDGLFWGILYLIAVSYTILFFMFRKKIIKFFKELSSMDR